MAILRVRTGEGIGGCRASRTVRKVCSASQSQTSRSAAEDTADCKYPEATKRTRGLLSCARASRTSRGTPGFMATRIVRSTLRPGSSTSNSRGPAPLNATAWRTTESVSPNGCRRPVETRSSPSRAVLASVRTFSPRRPRAGPGGGPGWTAVPGGWSQVTGADAALSGHGRVHAQDRVRRCGRRLTPSSPTGSMGMTGRRAGFFKFQRWTG